MKLVNNNKGIHMSYSLKPGVVTGEDYKTLLKAAKGGVMHFQL